MSATEHPSFLRIRVIPTLLLERGGLVKTVQFKNPTYVGDPINTMKIFNEKEVDEIAVLDIGATSQGRPPNFDMISDLASECFMPMAYGGGITSIEEIQKILYTGVEKVILNQTALLRPEIITEGAQQFGSQAIVVSIDAKRTLFGKHSVFADRGTRNAKLHPAEFAKQAEDRGAGEILLTSVDRDGTYSGYDIELISQVAKAVSIPVIACGGASNIADFQTAIQAGASAVAAGSLFVFHGKHRAVLINYPTQQDLCALFWGR